MLHKVDIKGIRPRSKDVVLLSLLLALSRYLRNNQTAQQASTCSKPTIETTEPGVKSVQS